MFKNRALQVKMVKTDLGETKEPELNMEQLIGLNVLIKDQVVHTAVVVVGTFAALTLIRAGHQIILYKVAQRYYQ